MKLLIAFILLALLAGGARAAEGDGRAVSFTREVAPLLAMKCLGCHDADKAKGGYRLHTFGAMFTPGSSEETPIVRGKAAVSHLYRLLVTTNEEDRMPQKDEPLTALQQAMVQRWIDQGARFDGTNQSLPLALLTAPAHPPAPRSYSRPVPITALAFDGAGQTLAASGHREITVWSSESGQLVRRIGPVAEKTFDLQFSPNGQWLAAASGTPGKMGEIRLIRATNGELSGVLSTLPDAALCLAFGADGKLLAAGGADNIIRIWNVETRKLLHTIEQHADWVLALAFSPDGKRLASGSRDKSARLFNIDSAELEETYTGHGDFVTAVGWADDKSILSVPRSGQAHRWNAGNARKTAEFSGWESDPTRLLVDGTNVFVASLETQIQHFTTVSNQLLRSWIGPRDAVYALAIHRPTRRLASGSHDGEICIWSWADGSVALRFMAAPGFVQRLSRP